MKELRDSLRLKYVWCCDVHLLPNQLVNPVAAFMHESMFLSNLGKFVLENFDKIGF